MVHVSEMVDHPHSSAALTGRLCSAWLSVMYPEEVKLLLLDVKVTVAGGSSTAFSLNITACSRARVTGLPAHKHQHMVQRVGIEGQYTSSRTVPALMPAAASVMAPGATPDTTTRVLFLAALMVRLVTQS
jgi:hypothetical protein